jgi:hypothetical protein
VRGRRRGQRRRDTLEHAVYILDQVAVPEAKHTPAMLFQHRGAALVIWLTQRVLAAVEFDREMLIDTGEVNNERPNGHLSPELVTERPTVAQLQPETAFDVGLEAPKTSRSIVSLLRPHESISLQP